MRRTDSIINSQQQFMLHGSPVINDCMYRNMYKFNRILVIDFDEVIMPKTASNLSQLISHLDQHYTNGKIIPPANYIFANNYFFLELPPNMAESPYFTFMRYTKRAAPSEYGYSVKSIIDPQSCVNMHNHYCWSVTPGYANKGHVDVVNSSFAINQHYKYCHLNSTQCAEAKSVFFEDNSMQRFKTVLKKCVKDKINLIMKHNI